MLLPELLSFFDTHDDALMGFLDFEPVGGGDVDDTLDAWFDSPAWRDSGHRFTGLGMDGTGGLFLAWHDPEATPDSPVPIVHLGSEGERGVLTASPGAFAQALAHGPGIADGWNELPARLAAGTSMYLDEDDVDADELAEAREALATWRLAVEARLGAVPPMDGLVAIPEALQARFFAVTAAWSPHL